MTSGLLIGASWVVVLSWAWNAQAGKPSFAGCVGWIAVESDPGESGEVLLDNQETGFHSPTTLKDIPCGKHLLSLAKPLYRSTKAVVNVRSGELARAKVKLIPNYANCSIQTVPSGARVEIDGKVIGTTPMSLERIEAGEHALRLSLPNHKDYRRQWKVVAGKDDTLRIPLAPNIGQLEVKSSEEAATVFLDGEVVGNTPIVLERVTSGFHIVRVSKVLYKSFEIKVWVDDGRKSLVSVPLTPDYGTLSVRSTPPGGKVSIDGQEIGFAPLTLQLPVGKHLVSVTEPSGGKEEREVMMGLLQKTDIQFSIPILDGIKTVPPLKGSTMAPPESVEKGSKIGDEIKFEKKTTNKLTLADPSSSVSKGAGENTLASNGPRSLDPSRRLFVARSRRTMSRERIVAWTTIGLSAASTVVSITLFSLFSSTQADSDAVYEKYELEADPVNRQKLKDRLDELDEDAANLLTGGWICAGTAAVAAGVAIYFFFSEPAPAQSGTAFLVSPLPHGGWVGVETRF